MYDLKTWRQCFLQRMIFHFGFVCTYAANDSMRWVQRFDFVKLHFIKFGNRIFNTFVNISFNLLPECVWILSRQKGCYILPKFAWNWILIFFVLQIFSFHGGKFIFGLYATHIEDKIEMKARKALLLFLFTAYFGRLLKYQQHHFCFLYTIIVMKKWC